MQRDINMDMISDGFRYRNSDMVKIQVNDCEGCSACCHDMGESIILDPYDIYNLAKVTGKSFGELLEESLELHVVDSVILPNIKMQVNSHACHYLSAEGRCTIHDNRPGFCRLFPLGRIYEDGGFKYFHQVHECSYQSKTKVKIKNWLGIPAIATYEKYILEWHNIIKKTEAAIDAAPDTDTEKRINMAILTTFFVTPYNTDESFYDQFYERIGNLDIL